jgi:cell wall-associated NlpC family hydrolase
VSRRIRLPLLVLTLLWLVALTPASVFAARAKAHRAHRDSKALRARKAIAARQLTRSNVFGERVVRYARRLLGVPYVYGGSSPSSGFDCSGFVRFVYQRFGVSLPHSSYADFDLGRSVSRSALQPGDLVFFHGLGHVGLYIGGGRFIHAPHTGTSVEVDSLNGWYAGVYDGARRLVAPLVAHRRLRPARPARPRNLAPLARWLLVRPS